MERGSVFVLAVIGIALAICMPAAEADASDSEIFTYYSLLDENGALVYKEVSKATAIDTDVREFTVPFKDSRLFTETDKAKEYADETVQDALAALYLTNPMIPYLWDYPVKAVETTASVSTVKIINSDAKESTYYVVDSVKFSLAVPEGITSESMKELNKAIEDITVTGNTNADKVLNIISHMERYAYVKEEEGKVSNIYDVLVTKKGTTAGFAQAVAVLCSLNDIPSIIVTGENALTSNETKSYWNYVYLQGDIDGETKYAWYIIDSVYARSVGIAGYLTDVMGETEAYSMSSAHNTNLTLSSENSLTVPQLAKNKYVPVGGKPFFEEYGEIIVIGGMGAILIGTFIYASRIGIL